MYCVPTYIYVGEYSGLLSRNSSVYLDRERVSQYTLNVSASDRGEPSNIATVEVIVNILVSFSMLYYCALKRCWLQTQFIISVPSTRPMMCQIFVYTFNT